MSPISFVSIICTIIYNSSHFLFMYNYISIATMTDDSLQCAIQNIASKKWDHSAFFLLIQLKFSKFDEGIIIYTTLMFDCL